VSLRRTVAGVSANSGDPGSLGRVRFERRGGVQAGKRAPRSLRSPGPRQPRRLRQWARVGGVASGAAACIKLFCGSARQPRQRRRQAISCCWGQHTATVVPGHLARACQAGGPPKHLMMMACCPWSYATRGALLAPLPLLLPPTLPILATSLTTAAPSSMKDAEVEQVGSDTTRGRPPARPCVRACVRVRECARARACVCLCACARNVAESTSDPNRQPPNLPPPGNAHPHPQSLPSGPPTIARPRAGLR